MPTSTPTDADPSRITDGEPRVYAILYGRRTSVRNHEFFGHVDGGDEAIELGFFVWLITIAGAAIVVDTGFAEDRAVVRGIQAYSSPLAGIASLGVLPGDVRDVVLTHLHHDHTGNISAFENATFYVQECELQFWCGKYAGNPTFSNLCAQEDLAYLVQANLSGRVRLENGDFQLMPGVSVHRVGGHTPGMQVVRVEMKDRVVVLASDASHLLENHVSGRPHSSSANLIGVIDAFDRIRDLAGKHGTIVPGHDLTPYASVLYPINGDEGSRCLVFPI